MGKSPAGLPSHPYPHLGTDQPPESAFDTDEFPLEIFLEKESLPAAWQRRKPAGWHGGRLRCEPPLILARGGAVGLGLPPVPTPGLNCRWTQGKTQRRTRLSVAAAAPWTGRGESPSVVGGGRGPGPADHHTPSSLFPRPSCIFTAHPHLRTLC